MKKLCRTIREIVFDIKRYPRDYLRAAIGFVVVFVCTAYLQNKFGTGQSILSENFGECFIPVFFGAIFLSFAFLRKILNIDMLKYCGFLQDVYYLWAGFCIAYNQMR